MRIWNFHKWPCNSFSWREILVKILTALQVRACSIWMEHFGKKHPQRPLKMEVHFEPLQFFNSFKLFNKGYSLEFHLSQYFWDKICFIGQFLERISNNMLKRVNLCIEVGGDNFEDLIWFNFQFIYLMSQNVFLEKNSLQSRDSIHFWTILHPKHPISP